MKTLRERRRALYKRYHSRVEDLHGAELNFEPQETPSAEEGWQSDDYKIELPPEPPGPPVAQDVWETAVDILMNYEFPPPSIISGIYGDDEPLEGRTMLLEGKFLFLRFYFGVRISRIIDDVVDGSLGPETLWGYSYRTLRGHWEQGEITFLLRKRHEDGSISFEIDAYSRKGRIPNPFYRFGFWLFGRWLQVRFAKKSLQRMKTLVRQRMQLERDARQIGS